MRPINSFEFKTRLLEERDKIPLTVPCAPYELRREKKSPFREGQRSGIRIALRCLEQTQTLLDYEFVPHGKWVLFNRVGDGGQYRCSICGRVYYFHCFNPIEDNPYCNCGAKMDLK